jgi:hypothetical protein
MQVLYAPPAWYNPAGIRYQVVGAGSTVQPNYKWGNEIITY